MRALWHSLLAVTLFLFALTEARAQGQYDEMVARIPEQANLLVLVDNDGLMKSNLGVQQNWSQNYQKSALGGMFSSPPNLWKLVLSAQIDHHTLENQWEVGVAALKHGYSLTNKDLVAATGGARDSVGGHEVTLTPQNTYLTMFDQRHVGVMRPANRQAMGRWMRTTGLIGSARVSSFLQQSVANMPKDAQALLVLDMTDMFEAQGLRQRFKKSSALADGNIDVEAATNLFSAIKGMTLALRVNNFITGEIRIYFEAPPTFLQPVAKKLFTNALTSMGATIDDFNDWDTSVDGNAIVLKGRLTQSSAREIFSPLYRPITIAGNGTDATANSPAAASKRYFNAVTSLIDDLKATKTRSLNERSFWHKQFADKIDALPVLNVDNDLLKYGAAVSATFRGLANFATNTLQQQRLVAQNANQGFTVTPGSSYYYGNGAGWGYGGTFPNVESNITIANNLIAQSGNSEIAIRNATWKNIEQATVEIRNRMTQKYQIEF
jgi:hypothetical protein